ncbi:MAG: cell division protein FtsH, partial [Candidatus Promineifilaceae bacterium]
ATSLGGRIAEEIIFGEITTGASNDLQQITKMARAMVTQYGMSDEMGLRVYGDRQELVFLGREISEQRDYSDAIAEKIDEQVMAIIDEQYTIARELLEANRDKLDLVANTLLEVETLEAEEFVALLDGKDLPSRSDDERKSKRPSSESKPNEEADWKKPPSLDLPPSPSPA